MVFTLRLESAAEYEMKKREQGENACWYGAYMYGLVLQVQVR